MFRNLKLIKYEKFIFKRAKRIRILKKKKGKRKLLEIRKKCLQIRIVLGSSYVYTE